ncbi:hypothetical protein B0H11DRAFT_1941433 [Mycena galericulata]|nr:hypothetical protein B0H11DRAFT_1941433 [Mycena galericulata]
MSLLLLLPVELLSLIVHYALLPYENDSPHIRVYTRGVIALLCKQLRDLVYDTPGWWNTFVIDRYTSAAYVKSCLLNSLTLPIDLQIETESWTSTCVIEATGLGERKRVRPAPTSTDDPIPFTHLPDDIIAHLAHHFHRVRSLYVRGSMPSSIYPLIVTLASFPAPNLSKLRYHMGRNMDAAASSLTFPAFASPVTTMYLASFPEMWIVRNPAYHLTVLKLYYTREPGVTWRRLFPALEAAVHLEVLHLLNADCHRINGGPVVTMHRLRELLISYGYDRAGRVARNIRMPNLETLILFAHEDGDIPTFLNANPQVFDTATRFIFGIRARSVRRGELPALVRVLGGAHCLDFRCSDVELIQGLLTVLDEDAAPALHGLRRLLLPSPITESQASKFLGGAFGVNVDLVTDTLHSRGERWSQLNGRSVMDFIPKERWRDYVGDYVDMAVIN